MIPCSAPEHLARSLRTWRVLRRMKQGHAAEMLGVSQATVSRWESGRQAPDPDEQAAIRCLLRASLDSAADRELARLVAQSRRPVHLICDLTHTLLALSPARERNCRVPASELMGTSLWPHASEEIVEAERRLAEFGWFEPAPPAVEGDTGENRSRELRILESRFRYVRFQLSDGSFARMVETVALRG